MSRSNSTGINPFIFCLLDALCKMMKFFQNLTRRAAPSSVSPHSPPTFLLYSRTLATFPPICRMRRHAVVKLVEGQPRFTFSFLLALSPGTERQFNLNRELVEPPAVFCERIGANVAKVVNKKKKNKKGSAVEENSDVVVQFWSRGGALSLGRKLFLIFLTSWK